MEFREKIPVICGPTGSGKTAVALEISKSIPIEIVSADSRQMIKQLNIGTAKPTSVEQAQVPFHLIDVFEPGENYSAFEFINDADNAIELIVSRKKLPVIVGGTGLYLKALSEGIFDIESDNTQIRIELEGEMEKLGAAEMYNRLKDLDPEEAARFHPNNKVRIVRALEIYGLTGKPKSELSKIARYKKSQFEFKFFCLLPPREELYLAIEDRVERMIINGLVGELEGLIKHGLKELVQKMNVIGYSELLEHLDGNYTLEEAVLLIKQNSRRYAKRQTTWIRHQVNCENFSSSNTLLAAFNKVYADFAQ